jgi:hypothetical protein
MVLAGGDVNLNAKSLLAVALSAAQKDGPIRLLILVKVSRNQSLTEQIIKLADAASQSQNCAAKPVLRPDRGRPENENGKHDSQNGRASIHPGFDRLRV